jgi:aminopeptidase-like protein
MAGDFSRIHTTEDKLEHVQPELLGAAASHGMEMLEILAGR